MVPENRIDKSSEGHRQRELLAQEARQAVPLGHMRYVLAISLVLVIVAFGLIYFVHI